jgi:hypothetical protein
MATVIKALSLGVHAVLVADIAVAGGSLLAGTKVFVSSLEPLAISTEAFSGILVPRESFKTTKGRPKKIASVVAPASVASSTEASAEIVRDLSIDGVLGVLTIDEIFSELSMG